MLDQLAGQALDRYQLLELLGEGGMGAVFRARDVALQRDVAVKVLQSQAARLPNYEERFLQEARAAARLDHPGVVKVYDFGQARGLLYIVMELIRGDNLRQMLDGLQAAGRTLPLPEAVGLIRQVCLAVDYVHRQGILHRDIKPGNIMLKPEPAEGLPYRPVLMDLGLAKLQEGSQLTVDGTSLGTPAYMSPEQALGERTDARSDVYSLGILLYELAVGQLPFTVRTLTEAIRCHTKEPPPPPRSLRPDLPEALERVILQALAKPAAERYPGAAAMAQALAQALPAAAKEAPTAGALAAGAAPAAEPMAARTGGSLVPAHLPTAPGDPGHDHISILAPDGTLRWLELGGAELGIGSARGNELALDDPAVSPQHARVLFDGATYRVLDLNSATGTYLANVRLLPGVAQEWRPEKALRIGPCWLRLERAQRPAPGARPSPATTVVSPAAATAAGARRVGAFLQTPELTVDPGASATAVLTIVNQGPVVDHFRVVVANLSPIWVPAPPPLLRLLPGAQQQVSIAIQPPRSPESRAGGYPLIVRVTSQDAPDQAAEVRGSLAVTAYQQFSAELRPQRQSSALAGSFRVLVHNWGNDDLTLQLSGLDPEEACEYTFQPAQVTVAPGQEGSAQLAVRPRSPLAAPVARTYRFTVNARPPQAPWLAQQVQGEWEETLAPQTTPPAVAPAGPFPGCAFWLLWVMATMLGGALSSLPWVLVDWQPLEMAIGQTATNAALTLLEGAIIGLLQWLVLRPFVRRSGWWLVLWPLGDALSILVRGALPQKDLRPFLGAAVLGGVQWLALRGKVRWSGLWVLASLLGWGLGSSLIVNLPRLGILEWKVLGDALVQAVGPYNVVGWGLDLDRTIHQAGWAIAWVVDCALAGAITGLALLGILRRPAAQAAVASAGTTPR